MADPAFAAEKRAHGTRLAEMRATLSLEVNAIIQRKSTATFLARTTAAERAAAASRAAAAARKIHPNLSQMGGRAAGAFWRSAAGREMASTKFLAAWKHGQMDSIAAKNRAHTISGRIPCVFRMAKPTPTEREMITFLTARKIALPYTGDGSLRVPIPPGGRRNWRVPDFADLPLRAAILLDRLTPSEPLLEAQDYRAAGWRTLRVRAQLLRTPDALEALIRNFLRSCACTESSATPFPASSTT
jgi:hypothetical protein